MKMLENVVEKCRKMRRNEKKRMNENECTVYTQTTSTQLICMKRMRNLNNVTTCNKQNENTMK